MNPLANVPFLGGYNAQNQVNRQQESAGMDQLGRLAQLQMAMEAKKHQKTKAKMEEEQHLLMGQYAQRLPPEEQMAFKLDPKGYLSAKREAAEMQSFFQNQGQAPQENLHGMEPIPNGVEGVQGFVGNAKELIMSIANRQDIPFQDKQAAIQQIMAQQGGAAGGGQALGGMPPGLMSPNKAIRESTRFQVGQQDKVEARTEARTAASERQAEMLDFRRDADATRREDAQAGRLQAIEARRALQLEMLEARRQDKADDAQGKIDGAKGRVSVNLKALGDYYGELKALGAAVDAEAGTAANTSARLRATLVGQTMGGIIGSKEQTIRDNIKQMQPLLLQEIRQATAMGARGMDSNKELDFYLQAATDPKRSIQSNVAAMQVLENAYGLSSKISDVDASAMSSLKAEWAALAGKEGAAPTTATPDKATWMVAAKKRNPKASGAELEAFYYQKFKPKQAGAVQ